MRGSAQVECLPVSLRISRWHDETADLAPRAVVSAAARRENAKGNKRHLSRSEQPINNQGSPLQPAALSLRNSSRQRAGVLAAAPLTGCGRGLSSHLFWAPLIFVNTGKTQCCMEKERELHPRVKSILAILSPRPVLTFKRPLESEIYFSARKDFRRLSAGSLT